MDELSKITGVNKSKAMKFGKPYLDLIAKYVEDNNIERAEDVVVKSVVNKSAKKIAIITNIDKKISLADISRSLGMSLPDLLNEIQTIVMSGTKLNLRAYVEELTDDEILDEVMDFFKKTHEDVMTKALKEYGEEFSKDDIHLMHIHFISEMAN